MDSLHRVGADGLVLPQVPAAPRLAVRPGGMCSLRADLSLLWPDPAILLRGKSTSHDRWAKLMGPGVLLIGLGSLGTVAAVNALGILTR